jgi:hypothetical protein
MSTNCISKIICKSVNCFRNLFDKIYDVKKFADCRFADFFLPIADFFSFADFAVANFFRKKSMTSLVCM